MHSRGEDNVNMPIVCNPSRKAYSRQVLGGKHVVRFRMRENHGEVTCDFSNGY